jgi:hypothetical protein
MGTIIKHQWHMNKTQAWNIGRILLMGGKLKYTSLTMCPTWTGLGSNLGLCNDGLGKNREQNYSLF